MCFFIFELFFDVIEIILIEMGKDIGAGIGFERDFLLRFRFVFSFGFLTRLYIVQFGRL
jgi:hypothetical protein